MQTSLHTRIKEKRIERGFSQLDFGTAIGVSQPTVANWENGSHVPRPLALRKISHTLKVEQSWLLSGTVSVARNPATPYLNTPIRHVPIYNWPTQIAHINSENRTGYVPIATEKIGLIAFQDIDVQTGIRTLSLLDFEADLSHAQTAGLIEKEGQLKLVQTLDKFAISARKAKLEMTIIDYGYAQD